MNQMEFGISTDSDEVSSRPNFCYFFFFLFNLLFDVIFEKSSMLKSIKKKRMNKKKKKMNNQFCGHWPFMRFLNLDIKDRGNCKPGCKFNLKFRLYDRLMFVVRLNEQQKRIHLLRFSPRSSRKNQRHVILYFISICNTRHTRIPYKSNKIRQPTKYINTMDSRKRRKKLSFL